MLVTHQERQLANLSPVQLAQPPDGKNFVLTTARHGMICDNRDLAVVVNKADSSQPVVSYSLTKLGQLEIPQKNATLGKCAVEFHHQRLVFRPDRPQGHRRAIL